MKVELEAKNIIIDGIDVFDHIGKVEKEANEAIQKIKKALFYVDMDKHISCNWDNMSNEEKDDFVLGLLNELERILKGVEEK